MYYNKDLGHYVDYASVTFEKNQLKNNLKSSFQSKDTNDMTETKALNIIVNNLLEMGYHTSSSQMGGYDGLTCVSANQYMQHDKGGPSAMICVEIDENKDMMCVNFMRHSNTDVGTEFFDDFKSALKKFGMEFTKEEVDSIELIYDEGNKYGAVSTALFSRQFEQWKSAKNEGVRNPQIVKIVDEVLKKNDDIIEYGFKDGKFAMTDHMLNHVEFKFDGTLKGFAEGIDSFSKSIDTMKGIPVMKELGKIQEYVNVSLEQQATADLFPDVKESVNNNKRGL